jgi:hypothetical protein
MFHTNPVKNILNPLQSLTDKDMALASEALKAKPAATKQAEPKLCSSTLPSTAYHNKN